MKFSIQLDELQYILKCTRICTKPNTTDPAGRINVIVDELGVRFVASNNLNSISIKSNTATPEAHGRTAILYSDLQPFVNSFRAYNEEKGGVDKIDFKLNEKSLSVSLKNFTKDGNVSKSRVRLRYFSVVMDEDLFAFPQTDFVLSSSMLKAALDKISFTIDPLHNVTFLRGASLMFDTNNIYVAGTNGVVISEHAVKNTSNTSDVSYILSHDFVKGLRNILSALPNEEASISFCINSGTIKIKIDDLIFTGNLIIGYEFPDYRSELLKEKKHVLTVDKEVLMNNLNPIINLLDPDDNFRLTINYTGNELRFYNDSSESVFNIEQHIDKDVKVDVNGRLLKEIINSIKDDQILLKLTDENNAVCFDSEMFEDQKALITPIKRRSE